MYLKLSGIYMCTFIAGERTDARAGYVPRNRNKIQ